MFTPIQGHWPREEHFAHYMNNLRCTYSLTVQIDITRLRNTLKRQGLRAYPAQVYMLARTVNQFPAFRMDVSPEGEPGHWDVLHPSYTVFNSREETFSSIWTAYDENFSAFYAASTKDMDAYSHTTHFAPKAGMPTNSFNISSIPWADFTAFNLNVFAEGTHLLPIFTLGKYVGENGKTLLPLALQVHHAACDGYHAGQFIEALRTLAAECDTWL